MRAKPRCTPTNESGELCLQQTEGIVETGAGLALGHFLLALSASPGERTDAVEISQHVNTVTLIETGLSLALVNINLALGSSPAGLAETGESLPDTIHALSTVLTANTPGLLAHSHVANLAATGFFKLMLGDKDTIKTQRRAQKMPKMLTFFGFG